MSVYMLTGKLGAGKTLNSVSRMQHYLNNERMVATNIDIHLPFLINPKSKNARVIRLPDKPVVENLQMLPKPYEGDYSEEKTGLLVLDECGTWFNTRNYKDKSRQPLIDHILHIRKKGWDVIFIVQHIEMIDKQIREGVGEHIIYCSRADRLGIPLITPIFKMIGIDLRMPKVHLATVRYGTGQQAPVVDRWVTTGTELYNAYDTAQVFGLNDCGTHCLLPPYSIYGRLLDEKRLLRAKLQNTFNRLAETLAKAKFLFFLVGVFLTTLINNTLFAKEEVKEEVKPTEVTQKQPDVSDIAYKNGNSNIFDGIFITASVKMRDGVLFVFQSNNGQILYSDEMENRVLYRGYCHAQIIFENHKQDVYCKQNTTEAPTPTREVSL